MRINGFDLVELHTKNGRHILVELKGRSMEEYKAVDKFIRESYNVYGVLDNENTKDRAFCYKIRAED